MPRMSKIELFAAIGRDLATGMPGRAIEEKYRVGGRTVSAAAVSALPPPRKAMPSRGSKLDPFKPAIDEILRADLVRCSQNSRSPRSGTASRLRRSVRPGSGNQQGGSRRLTSPA